MADTKKAFWEAKNTKFVEPEPQDEFLHPEARQDEPGAGLTETQYIGFNIPEHDIHALCYMWHHPNLGVVSGGAWAWKGIKRGSLSCELFDMLIYVDDAALANDLHHFELPNSYQVDVIEPLSRLRIRYSDEPRGNAFDIELDAVAKPMGLETGFHFEQPMKTRGSLTLAGTDYAVDAYTVRDRSWGQLRHEAHSDLPPIAWMTGVFGPDLMFGTTAFDSEDTDPEWKGVMSVPGGDPLRGGWIYHDGDYVPVVSVSKRTVRNELTLFPEAVELTIADATGYSMDIHGTVTAASNWRAWHNMDSVICLTRWECDGRVGYGDTQDVQLQSYVRQFAAHGLRRSGATA
jgi:hypothetical protein